MLTPPTSTPNPSKARHNVMGQRLGRKGQETRERILGAFERLLQSPMPCPVTLSGVAREAAIGMSALYLYFPDLGSLVLAGLRRITHQGTIDFVDALRTRWPDDDLASAALSFTRQYYGFWRQNGRILHMRNMLADSNDPRFLEARHQTTLPMVKMLAYQMYGDPELSTGFTIHFAMVLLTSLERICTVVTNPYFPFREGDDVTPVPDHVADLIVAEARLIEVAIRHQRQAGAVPAADGA